MSKSKRWNKRSWLNSDKSMTGFIYWEVEKEAGEEQFLFSWGSVRIGDCSRIVNLEFPLGKPSENRRSLKKLDNMIDQLNQFRDVIVKEFDT